MAKNRLLAVCHAFNINRNAIQTVGFICLEKYSAIQTTAAIYLENHSSVGMVEVSYSQFKSIQSFQQEGFSIRQRESVSVCVKLFCLLMKFATLSTRCLARDQNRGKICQRMMISSL